MLIINLNIRGLGGGTKARYLNHIIAREGAEFVCIQETKALQFSDARCYSLWGDNKAGWLHYEGDNGSGSLFSMWHRDAFIYESHAMGKGFIVVFGQHIKANCRCVVVNIYVACLLREKKVLWWELTRIKLVSQYLIWCFCGDFNVVRSLSERKGIRERDIQSSETRDFNCFIDANFLIEFPFVGKKFTWFNSNGSAKSRLDRVLVTEDWM